MTFDQHIGMEYEGSGKPARIVIQDHHKNPTGNINGGVIISMADNISTGCAGFHYHEKFGEQKFLVGVDLHAVMLSNQLGGTITAEAYPVRIGRRICVVRTEIKGDDGKLLAEVTTTHVPT